MIPTFSKMGAAAGGGKMAQGIQYAHEEGHDSDKKNVRECQPGEENRQIMLYPRTSKTKGLNLDNVRGQTGSQVG